MSIENTKTRYKVTEESKPAIWNPERAVEGVFCPTCGKWLDDYYGRIEKCPDCGQRISGWIDEREHPPKLYP